MRSDPPRKQPPAPADRPPGGAAAAGSGRRLVRHPEADGLRSRHAGFAAVFGIFYRFREVGSQVVNFRRRDR